MLQPMRIDFELDTPYSPSGMPIHLDGVLAFARVQEGLNLESSSSISELESDLPLEQSNGVWHASYLFFSSGEKSRIPIQRSFDGHQTIMDNGVVYNARRIKQWDAEKSSSPFKAYLFNVPMMASRHAVAYAVGDIERVRDLLEKHVHNLGRLGRINAGHVRSITITKDERAMDLWQLRTLPTQKDGYIPSYQTIKPPYWKRELRQAAFVPSRQLCEIRLKGI